MTTQAWVPAGLAERLKVGARVQVRLSGECQTPPTPNSVAAQGGNNIMHSGIDTDGRSGTIVVITQRGSPANHPYIVEIDGGIEYQGMTFPCEHFAAIELIPIEEEEAQK